MAFLSAPELKKKILENPDLLRKTIKENPALFNYVLSDAEIRRKYVKIPAEEEKKLKKVARASGIAEGVLIGLGIAVLVWILFGDKK